MGNSYSKVVCHRVAQGAVGEGEALTAEGLVLLL